MKQIKPWLLLALVFFMGLILGVAGTRLAARRAMREAALHPARVQMLMERRLSRRLHLDMDQQARLDQIFTDTRSQLQTIRQQYHPAVSLVFSNASQQINALLTPEQRVHFEKIKAENATFLHGLQLLP